MWVGIVSLMITMSFNELFIRVAWEPGSQGAHLALASSIWHPAYTTLAFTPGTFTWDLSPGVWHLELFTWHINLASVILPISPASVQILFCALQLHLVSFTWRLTPCTCHLAHIPLESGTFTVHISPDIWHIVPCTST